MDLHHGCTADAQPPVLLWRVASHPCRLSWFLSPLSTNQLSPAPCLALQVLIKTNAFDTNFWINVILTLLAWLPGAIHALWVVFNEPGKDEFSPLTRPFAEV